MKVKVALNAKRPAKSSEHNEQHKDLALGQWSDEESESQGNGESTVNLATAFAALPNYLRMSPEQRRL